MYSRAVGVFLVSSFLSKLCKCCPSVHNFWRNPSMGIKVGKVRVSIPLEKFYLQKRLSNRSLDIL